jgi:Adenylate cyclase, class 2 (thermophilic)
MEFRQGESELRLRRITWKNGEKIVLTCKEPPLDQIARSKPEREVQVNSFEQAADVLRGLGYIEDISFTKSCTNMRLTFQSADITVSLVTMDELNQDFIEAEVLIAETGNLDRTYACLHEFLLTLQIMPEQLTSEYYTDMVRQARGL